MSLFWESDAHVEALLGRELLRHLPVERLERVGELTEIRAQHRFFPATGTVRAKPPSQAIFSSAWPARLSTEPESAPGAASSLLRGVKPVLRILDLTLSGAHGVDRVPAPGDLGQTRVERIARAQRVGVGLRRIELQEQVPRP